MVETDSLRWWLVPRHIWPQERSALVRAELERAGCELRTQHTSAEEALLRTKFPHVDPKNLDFYGWLRLPTGWFWAFDADDMYLEEVLLEGGVDDREEVLVIRCERGIDRIAVRGWQRDEPPQLTLLNVGLAFAQRALDGDTVDWAQLTEPELHQALVELTGSIADFEEYASDAAIRERAAVLSAQVRRQLRGKGGP